MRRLPLQVLLVIALALQIVPVALAQAAADPEAMKKVNQIIATIKNPKADYKAKRNAIRALGDRKLDAVRDAAIPALVEALASKERYVGSDAAGALGKIGAAALPGVLDALKSDDMAANAIRALVSMRGPAVEPLTKLLTDTDPALRLRAATALAQMAGSAAEAVPALITALNDKSADVRGMSAYGLGRMRQAAAPAVPALVEHIKDPDPAVCRNSITALKSLGDVAADASPALSAILTDTKAPARQRCMAAEALGTIGGTGTDALVSVLSSENEALRWQAALSLGAGTEAIAPKLIAALENKNVLTRRYAAFALALMGPKAKPAVSALTQALADKEPVVRRNAADALGRIGPDAAPAQDALAGATKDKDYGVCLASVRALGTVANAGANVPRATKALVGLLKSSKASDMKCAVASSLGMMGQGSAEAIPLLVEGLNDANSGVRWSCAQALIKMGPAAQAPLAGLIKSEKANPWATYAYERIQDAGKAAK